MPYKEFDVNGVGKVKIYKRRANRRLRLTVAADGAVRISMPLWTPYRAGLAFMLSKLAWIQAQGKQTPPLLMSGMRIGKSHHLTFEPVVRATAIKTRVYSTQITVSHGAHLASSDAAVQAAARTACIRALRRQAMTLLAQRLEELGSRHAIGYKSLSIKRMKSRWGSCDQHRNIVLNLYLVQLPWEFIDYVIRHELAHTRVLHHGSDFWKELEALEPAARQLRRAIKAYQPMLLPIA
jgi:predicted metal-dependent hydrolase